jgi:hypothetical protein
MRTAYLHKGDRIKCEVKGRVFAARLIDKAGRVLRIEPEDRQVTNRFIRASQVREKLSGVSR